MVGWFDCDHMGVFSAHIVSVSLPPITCVTINLADLSDGMAGHMCWVLLDQ